MYLADELVIKVEEVCHILTEMINNRLINGLIDDVEGVFENHDFLVNREQREQIKSLNTILNNVQKVF